MESIYKKMYYRLFNAVTDAIDALAHNNLPMARWFLVKAQQECEDLYLDSEETE